MVAWIKANITIHLQPPAFLAASFSSCVVTLPSASCTEHCLSGHAWRCICACLYLCMCAPLLPTSRNKGGPTRERLEVSVKTPTDTGRWRKRRDRKSKEKGRVRWWWGGGLPIIPGRQPRAQIGPMGTHSLYTCSNQLAAATCLGGGITLRHTPTFGEAGESLRRRSSAAQAGRDQRVMRLTEAGKRAGRAAAAAAGGGVRTVRESESAASSAVCS